MAVSESRGLSVSIKMLLLGGPQSGSVAPMPVVVVGNQNAKLSLDSPVYLV